MAPRRPGSRPRPGDESPERFDEFDVTHAAEDESGFEEFDVTREPVSPAEAEISLEALGGITESEDELRSVLQAKDELERRLLLDVEDHLAATAEDGSGGFGNIVGLGMGEESVAGSPTGRLAAKVFVKEKLHSSRVASEALAPDEIGGVPVDVDETGEIRADAFTARRRPAPCGVSIGNCNMVMAGTLGCLVARGTQLFILSNNHVMALVNQGPLGVGIPQPGRLDGGRCPADIIARLSHFIPIAFGSGSTNIIDAAIAQTSPRLVDRRVLRVGGALQAFVPPEVAPTLNQMVQKSGRTTQYRRGLIDAISVTVNVSYAPLGGVARFVNQFRVRGIGAVFSDRGDSGSLVSTFPRNNPVGLLFAGNAANNVTFCNDIRRVVGAFGVRIVY